MKKKTIKKNCEVALVWSGRYVTKVGQQQQNNNNNKAKQQDFWKSKENLWNPTEILLIFITQVKWKSYSNPTDIYHANEMEHRIYLFSDIKSNLTSWIKGNLGHISGWPQIVLGFLMILPRQSKCVDRSKLQTSSSSRSSLTWTYDYEFSIIKLFMIIENLIQASVGHKAVLLQAVFSHTLGFHHWKPIRSSIVIPGWSTWK